MSEPEYENCSTVDSALLFGVQKKCIVTVAFTVFVGLLAMLVLVGWLLQHRPIVQLSLGLAPMQATTALGFLFASAALFFLSAGFSRIRWRPEYWFSFLLLIWGILNFIQHITSLHLGIDTLFAIPFVTESSPTPGRMSFTASISFILSGVTLLLSSPRESKPVVEVVIVFLSGLVAGGSGAVLLCYMANIPPVVWLGGRFTEMAPQSALCFFLLSTGTIMQRFRCGRAAEPDALRWMWAPTLCAMLFAVFSVYLGLACKAEQSRQEAAILRAESMTDLVQARLSELVEALSRMARRVAGMPTAQRNLWDRDAYRFLTDFSSLVFLRVGNRDVSLDWYYPERNVSRYILWTDERPDVFKPAGSTVIQVVQDKPGKAYLRVDVYESDWTYADPASLLLSAIVDSENLVEKTIKSTFAMKNGKGVNISIEPATETHSSGVFSGYTLYSAINPNWNWVVSVDPGSLPSDRHLQDFFLIFGTILSGMLAYLVHSVRLGRERFNQLEQAQWALARQKSRLEAFVTHAPASVAMFDRRMRYLAASNQWIRDYELEGIPLIGRSHYEIFPDVGEEWKQIHQRSLLGHVEHCERDCWRPSGWNHDQYLRWEVRPWREPDGGIGGIMMFTADISADVEREQEYILMREEADEANQLKSQFLANISHEIRTPMNGVLGMTSLLQDSFLNADQKEYVDVIRESADALLTLIDDILDFSKIEAGKVTLENECFSLTELIASTVELLAPIANRRYNEILAWVELDGTVDVMGDSGRLRQILTNLLGNAVKFTEHGDISLSVTPREILADALTLKFEVRDTGIGMTPEQCARIFQPFVQADGSTARKYGGTGLGLSISHRLVEVMGGALQVESQPGAGTTFSFTLTFPLADGGKNPPSIPGLMGFLEGKRCLLAFYSGYAARLVAERLTKWGLTPEIALSLEETREAIRQRQLEGTPFDVVLLDACLDFQHPERLIKETGLEQSGTDSRRSRVVLLKGAGLVLSPEQAQVLGIDQLVRKPLTPSRILDTLSNFFQRRLHEHPAVLRADDDSPGTSQFSGLHVLVADDNSVNRKVIGMLLKRMGIESDTASDGEEAVESWGQVGYPVIIMDCQMPGMDGFTATRRIREIYAEKQVRGEDCVRPYIIALTANAQIGDREKCQTAGMDDYVAKPARKEQLYEALERWWAQNGRPP